MKKRTLIVTLIVLIFYFSSCLWFLYKQGLQLADSENRNLSMYSQNIENALLGELLLQDKVGLHVVTKSLLEKFKLEQIFMSSKPIECENNIHWFSDIQFRPCWSGPIKSSNQQTFIRVEGKPVTLVQKSLLMDLLPIIGSGIIINLIALFPAIKLKRMEKHLEQEKLRNQKLVNETRMVAHDIRKPFSQLSAYVQVLNGLNENNKIVTHHVQDDIKQSISFIDDMLTHLVEPNPKSKIEVARFDLFNLLLTAAKTACQPYLKNISFDVSAPTCTGDPQQLRRVFENILGNAIEITKGDTSIAIIAEERTILERQILEITIENTNSFISSIDLPHIFSEHYSKREGGHGLGLAICKKIIESHDGSIRCSSNEIYRRTAFKITLPVKHNLQSV